MSELELVNEDKPMVEAPVLQAMDPMALITLGVQRGDDVERMTQLYELKKTFERDEARKAYHLAVAQFKNESIEIIKNKTVAYKDVSYNHASLDHIVEVTAPLLAKHGLSHNWDLEQGDKGRVTVTCVLTHSLGHSNKVALVGSPDDSGSKNNIQRVASTVTYLERYTFLAITGLAAKDQDDDGANSGERFDKAAFEKGKTEGCEMGKFWFEHKDRIEEIKDALADDNYLAAAEVFYSFTNIELGMISRAPTKGGIFNGDEKKKMTSIEWTNVTKEAIELNPTVDRSL